VQKEREDIDPCPLLFGLGLSEALSWTERNIRTACLSTATFRGCAAASPGPSGPRPRRIRDVSAGAFWHYSVYLTQDWHADKAPRALEYVSHECWRTKPKHPTFQSFTLYFPIFNRNPPTHMQVVQGAENSSVATVPSASRTDQSGALPTNRHGQRPMPRPQDIGAPDHTPYISPLLLHRAPRFRVVLAWHHPGPCSGGCVEFVSAWLAARRSMGRQGVPRA
jgi:hypothetical protein